MTGNHVQSPLVVFMCRVAVSSASVVERLLSSEKKPLKSSENNKIYKRKRHPPTRDRTIQTLQNSTRDPPTHLHRKHRTRYDAPCPRKTTTHQPKTDRDHNSKNTRSVLVRKPRVPRLPRKVHHHTPTEQAESHTNHPCHRVPRHHETLQETRVRHTHDRRSNRESTQGTQAPLIRPTQQRLHKTHTGLSSAEPLCCSRIRSRGQYRTDLQASQVKPPAPTTPPDTTVEINNTH